MEKECQKKLKAGGLPYPRTCSICGLGPCQKGYNDGPVKVRDTCFLIHNEATGKRVVVMDEEKADKLADLMDTRYEEIPLLVE